MNTYETFLDSYGKESKQIFVSPYIVRYLEGDVKSAYLLSYIINNSLPEINGEPNEKLVNYGELKVFSESDKNVSINVGLTEEEIKEILKSLIEKRLLTCVYGKLKTKYIPNYRTLIDIYPKENLKVNDTDYKSLQKELIKFMEENGIEGSKYYDSKNTIIKTLRRNGGMCFSRQQMETFEKLSGIDNPSPLDCLKSIFLRKNAEWRYDLPMKRFINPLTLFRGGNVDKYLDEVFANHKKIRFEKITKINKESKPVEEKVKNVTKEEREKNLKIISKIISDLKANNHRSQIDEILNLIRGEKPHSKEFLNENKLSYDRKKDLEREKQDFFNSK